MRPASEAEDTGEADHDAKGGACRLTGAGLDSRRITSQIKPRAPRACPLYQMRSTALPWSSTQNGTFGTFFGLTIIQFGKRSDFRRATPNQSRLLRSTPQCGETSLWKIAWLTQRPSPTG